MITAAAPPMSVVLPMKRARPSDTTTLGSGTHPSFTPELAKMLGAYIAAYGELPSTESIPPPVAMIRLGAAPSRSLPQASSVTLGANLPSIIIQEIPLVAGLKLHLELRLDTAKPAVSVLVQIKGIPIIGSITVGTYNVVSGGPPCEFGQRGNLFVSFYFSGRTLKLELDVAGNMSTIDIITISP